MERKTSLDIKWSYLDLKDDGTWMVKNEFGISYETDDKDDALEWLKSENRELLENKIICHLRKFSENGYEDFTTGFQRYEARDIINLVREHDKLKTR
jgi:hypothetical protein